MDLDQPIRDTLLLYTLPGAVDYLAEDVRHLPGATITRRFRSGVLVSYEGPLRPLAAIRYFDVASVPVASGGDGDPADGDDALAKPDDAGLAGLSGSLEHGVLSLLPTPVRFRVADIGTERWNLADQLKDRLGWENSAGDWVVNIDQAADQLVAEIGPLHLTQRFGALERMPASTNPVVAAVMVRLAKLEPGDVVLDPFCGAGTLLTIAGQTTEDLTLIGRDQSPGWIGLTAKNLESRSLTGDLAPGDAGSLDLADASVDRVISNLPFGKRIGSHSGNTQLYPAALREIARVMHGRSRAVLLTDDKRLFKESVQRTPLIRVVKEIMLEQHGGLHPTAYVISKRGSTRRR